MEPHGANTRSESLNTSIDLNNNNNNNDDNNNNNPLSLEALAQIRSLIINPNTSNPTLLSLFETLTRSSQLTRDSTHHCTLQLLTDLATHHNHLSPLIFDSISSNSLHSDSTRLAVESLDALASVSEHLELDDHLFLSLCFGHSVSVRSWLLRNAQRFRVRKSLLLTVYLGFTKDPYPLVRRDALDGLNAVCKSLDDFVSDDHELILGCYRRAVELLLDHEDCVRQAAVRVVSKWGLVLVASKEKESRIAWSNTVFIQLCSMVRDMNMEVRREAFDALGLVELVSDNILLQTLSKKVLETSKVKNSQGHFMAEWFQISASNAAGAFVHGLEDEFHESSLPVLWLEIKPVRKSTCKALRSLGILSTKFANEALNLLMDILNDDSLAVRSQALETMHHMVTYKHLKLLEIHVHQLLGSLLDSEDFMRSTTKKILKLVKLSNLRLFKLSVDALFKNLDKYPQDEADTFSVLFHVGRAHGNYTVQTMKEVFHEIEPESKGKLRFDSKRVAALLVLAISVPPSENHTINPAVFSYAATLLGRIARSLSGVINQNDLLAYLSQRSRSPTSSETYLLAEKPFLPVVSDDVPKISSDEISCPAELALQQTSAISEVQTWICQEQDKVDEDLKACKEEITTFTTSEVLGSTGALAFTLHYLRVIKLLAKVWELLMGTQKLSFFQSGNVELLLRKLERRLKKLRCRFTGLSKNEELHVFELMAVTYLLRLSRVEIYDCLTAVKKLSAIVSRLEFLCDQTAEGSDFVTAVSKQLQDIDTYSGNCYMPFLSNKLLDFFFLKQFALSGSLKYLSAELDIASNFENTLPFITGLPVCIPLNITLHNIPHKNRIWLSLSMGEESTQFVFLDLDVVIGCKESGRFTFNAPFYRTPKADYFTLKVCIVMEWLFEELHITKVQKGPKNDLVRLSKEKEVHLALLKNKEKCILGI
ncbi:hypothetical protein ACFE04_001192 [Oxalis oulophora]